MCGADTEQKLSFVKREGSSPRVRSRQARSGVQSARHGIISACAEQTFMLSTFRLVDGDHLRVCGADYPNIASELWFDGSSPRVRSRHSEERHQVYGERIISACAEQTECFQYCRPETWDHLRVCGADPFGPFVHRLLRGSSPRVRSRPGGTGRADVRWWIISACAEQTNAAASASAAETDHLRVCGADSDQVDSLIDSLGSSPRVRSRPWSPAFADRGPGIISACAEQTGGCG